MIRKSNVQERIRKFHGVLTKFSEAMETKAKRMHLDGGALAGIPWEKDTVPLDQLLNLRRLIRDTVKRGIDNREDVEVEIAVPSCLIWFVRMEESRKESILALW